MSGMPDPFRFRRDGQPERRRPHLPSSPVGTKRVYSPGELRRGDLIHFEGQLWNVLKVGRTDRDGIDWIVVIRPHGESLEWTARSGDQHLGAKGYASFDRFIDSEHYPVCVTCGGPWPCRHLHIEREAATSLDKADRYATPNVCPACQEPVTTRQLRQTWQVNLYALDRDQPVTFHLRRKCVDEAIAYDEKVREAGHAGQLGYDTKGQSR